VPPAKTLRANVSACFGRLVKEMESYEKEAKAQEAKIQKMREDGMDFYDIRKQEEVLQESYMMIPDSKSRLQRGIEDLKAFMVRFPATFLTDPRSVEPLFFVLQDENGELAEVRESEFCAEATEVLGKFGENETPSEADEAAA
jgi:tubulin-specific chaperone A